MENSNSSTKIYVYSRHTQGTKEQTDKLECPKGLYWWAENEKAGSNEETVLTELFFAIEPISEESIKVNNLIPLGEESFQEFYVSEEIEGKQYTYVSKSLEGNVVPLYPVSWSGARTYLIQHRKTNAIYEESLFRAREITKRFPATYSYIGHFTRENAVKYGITIGNPNQDPENSSFTKKYFDKLNKKAEPIDESSSGSKTITRIPLPTPFVKPFKQNSTDKQRLLDSYDSYFASLPYMSPTEENEKVMGR